MGFLRVLPKIGDRRYRRTVIVFGVTLVASHRTDGKYIDGRLPYSVNEVYSHLFNALDELGSVESEY